jgi:hypothetical protein
MEIILVTSIILVAMVFLRKFLKTEAPVEEYEEEISEGAGYEEEIEQEEYAVDEFLEPEQGREAVQTPPPTETAGIVSKEHREPPHYKPRNYYLDIILILALTLLTVAFILVPALNKTFVRTILEFYWYCSYLAIHSSPPSSPNGEIWTVLKGLLFLLV